MNEKEFLDRVAELLEVDMEDISMDTEQGSIPEWDSIGHLTLLMGLSQTTGVELNPDLVAELVKLKAIHNFFTV